MSADLKELICFFEKENIAFGLNENVAARSSFKVGGTVAVAVFPDTKEKLVSALDEISSHGIRYEVIGNASNMLFAFDFFDGAFIFTSKLSDYAVSNEEKCIVASCGVSLTHLSDVAAQNGLCGLEFAYGIPALVGGAVYMNAGAYGSCISNVLLESMAYDVKNKKTVTLSASEHGFGYRHSVYMCNSSLVCLEAKFSLALGSESDIRQKMNENMRSRKEKQPLKYPSAGSYFKRPEGNFAGKLIEDCGLKGFSVGGAQVSQKHAGFIINTGGATFADILELEEKIKERVMSAYGVILEREVRLVK